jgi:hypothetical protein
MLHQGYWSENFVSTTFERAAHTPPHPQERLDPEPPNPSSGLLLGGTKGHALIAIKLEM